jgi:tripartite ATP-independent transporter DctM subunit
MPHIVLAFSLLMLAIALGFPIFLSLCIAGIVVTLALGAPISLVITKIFGGIDSFTLMAIPFFILAGNIMTEAKITDRIVDFADSLVGRFRGGLGHANILSSMIFSGIQGSGVADASAIGTIMIPAMVKQGYDRDFAVAVTASAAVMGPIIPPSIAMIMYGYYTELSVGKLFLGGLLPGILLGLGLMVVNALVFQRRQYQIRPARRSLPDVCRAAFRSTGALIMPLIIICGIVFGFFTPTESGIAATLYGVFYGFCISRELKWKRLPKVLVDSASTTAVVMIILAMAGIFSNLLTRLHFQQILIDRFVTPIQNPYLATLSIMLILILLGCFIDPSVLIVMFGSTVAGVGSHLGFDPVHYGVLMIIVMLFGALTPPVGSMLFIACSIAQIQIDRTVRVLLPFLTVQLVVIALVLFIPGLSLWVNHLVFR